MATLLSHLSVQRELLRAKRTLITRHDSDLKVRRSAWPLDLGIILPHCNAGGRMPAVLLDAASI